LRAILGRLDPGAVVREMYQRLRDIPAYARYVDADPETRGRAAIQWNVALVLRWLSDGVAPDSDMLSELQEVVRAHAVANEPIEDGLLVYRRGVRILRNTLLDVASDDERPILLEQADILWSYLDLVVDAFGKAYADRQDSPRTLGERRARSLLDHLCAGLPITVEDRDRASRLGFELRAEFRPFSATIVGAPLQDHINLAARLRDRRVLATTEGTRVTGLTSGDFDWTALLADGRVAVAYDRPTEPARLDPVLDDLRMLTRLAVHAGRTGLISGRDFFPQLLLARSPEIARELTRRVFDGLEGTNNAELVTTLRSLAANGFDRGAAATALIVHRNTLLYRINRIEKLTGLDLQSHADRELVYLALLWTDIEGLLGQR
jgi:PucR C-terminal helix-turn-helix domain